METFLAKQNGEVTVTGRKTVYTALRSVLIKKTPAKSLVEALCSIQTMFLSNQVWTKVADILWTVEVLTTRVEATKAEVRMPLWVGQYISRKICFHYNNRSNLAEEIRFLKFFVNPNAGFEII